ncbi:acyl-CoA dehydrogenase family protein [Bacillus sp. 2205SS5-2]|uniref:acyl-CoA dehydrogenase family protein n=1 Tax=Bacillus sp. 2205SS5-2 TaxID=3109031 RepID=UPI0030070BEE
MNFYQNDSLLKDILKHQLEDDFFQWADGELTEYGQLCGTEIDERAKHTDREGQPKLLKYDRFGNDVSEVWLNEGYKQTIRDTYERGIVGYIHKAIPLLGRTGNYTYSFAQGYLLSQSEPGFYCPVTLTMATAYLLDHYGSDEVKNRFLPHILSTGEVELYEGATFLTERQGGSDVGANVVSAKLTENGSYQLYGEKYFASNAGACGVAMVLARREGAAEGTRGLSLFAVPWRNNNGSVNQITIRRLKDKLGVRAVPSAEIVFEGSEAYLVGEAAKGIHYMMEALNLSRVCNAIASIGIMKRAYEEAKTYAMEREAFGKRLTSYPMIRESLVKMSVKHEVDTRAIFSLISLFEKVMKKGSSATDEEKVLNRLLIALLKKESAEQSIHFAHEAIEMHGGNGYIEDFVTPRLLRDAQVLTVWEGTANVLGLEVLRLMNRYQAHALFIEKMEKEYSHLTTEQQQIGKEVISGLAQLKELTEYSMNSSEDVQTYHCKRIARLMTYIYESIVILKVISTPRSRKVAEVFLRDTWQKEEWKDEKLLGHQYFDDIVLHKAHQGV